MPITMKIPTYKEWDKMMDVCQENNNLTHWRNVLSWVSDEGLMKGTGMSRGYDLACDWEYNNTLYQSQYIGFRPAFDNLTSDASEDGDVKVIGTLYMDGIPVRVPSNPTRKGDIQDYIPGAKLEMRKPLDDPQYQVRAIKVGSTYIADRVLLKNISYEDIAAAISDTDDSSQKQQSILCVQTPHGTLIARPTGEDEYPGIVIELEKGTNKADNITLALTEYIPGGESLSDYAPSNPTLMAQQRHEVPESRRMVKENGHACVTAGFVTRTWPHERLDESLHYRTFHDVYEDADLSYTTCDEFGNIQTVQRYDPPTIRGWKAIAQSYTGTGRTCEAAEADLVKKVEENTQYRGLTTIAKHIGYSVYAEDTEGNLYPMSGSSKQGVFTYA